MTQTGSQSQALTDDVILDFSGLFSSGSSSADVAETGFQWTMKAPEQIQREAEENKRALEICKAYQENARKSEQLQTDILKGVRAGADIYTLFLQAVDAISRMTANAYFQAQIVEDIKSIYGAGLLEKPPLRLELEQTQTRLQRLTEAREREQSFDGEQRIVAAIRAHESRIEELESLINRAS